MRVFRPETEADLVAWVQSSRARFRDEGVPVVTGLGVDRPATEFGSLPRLGVSTDKLSEVVDFRPRDLTITVGAGMRMSALATILEEEGLWLPLSETSDDRSVGGWVAAAPAGEFDGSFGPVRRHVLACTLLQWDGRSTRWGRPVMKNVAGYEVVKLVCGSRARLGILTTVTLRLWPRPRELRWFELTGEKLREDEITLAGAPRAEAILRRGRPGTGEPIRVSAALVGGPKSVQNRVRALESWAGDRGIDLREDDLGSSDVIPDAGSRPARPANSAAYRITFGRRYLTAGLRDLDRRLAGEVDPWRMEALPASGVVCLLTEQQKAAGERQAPAWLTTVVDTVSRTSAWQPGLDAPAVRIERGGRAEHEAARRMRSTGARDIERRWVAAFGGVDVPWQADYL